MSVEALTWAFGIEVGHPTRKLVLIALADHAGIDNQCWPSQAKLAARAECSVDTIQRHLASLEKDGLVTRQKRGRSDGGRASDLYKLELSVTPLNRNLLGGVKPHPCGGGKAAPMQCTNTAPVRYEPPLEPSKIEPSKKNQDDDSFLVTQTDGKILKKESARPSLIQQLSAADDIDESDEARFWAAVDVLAKAGVPRSQMAKLAKLTEAFDECLPILRQVAQAREPISYLAKIVRNRKAEADAERGLGASEDEPQIVRDHRRDGFPISREGKHWRCGRWLFDRDGVELGC